MGCSLIVCPRRICLSNKLATRIDSFGDISRSITDSNVGGSGQIFGNPLGGIEMLGYRVV